MLSDTTDSEQDSDSVSYEDKKVYTFEGNHLQELCGALNKFRLTDSKYCDVVLEADEQTFPAHKCVLASMSEFFNKMFTLDLQEKYSGSVKISQVSAETLKLVLDFMYTSKITLDEDVAYDILAASDFFMLNSLKDFACDILENEQTPENCLRIWQYAKKYSAVNLEKQSGKFIAGHFSEITEEDFLEFDRETIKEVVLLKDVNRNEEDVFDFIIVWVKSNEENRKGFFPELFNTLQLKKISKVFFTQVVLKESLVRNHEEIFYKVVDVVCGQIEDEQQKMKDMELCIQPSTSMLVVTSKGTLRKFDIRNNYQEPVSSVKFEGYGAVVKVRDWIYLLGCKTTNDSPTTKVVKFDLTSPHDGWQDSEPLPQILSNIAATVVDDSFIVVSSDIATYVFDCATSEWKSLGENNLKNETFLVSQEGQAIGLSSWKYYNVKNDTWQSPANPFGSVDTGVAKNDCLYLFASDKAPTNPSAVGLFGGLSEPARQSGAFGRFGQPAAKSRDFGFGTSPASFSQGGLFGTVSATPRNETVYGLWRYNTKSGKKRLIQESSSGRSATSVCFVDGKIVAVMYRSNERLVKEFDVTQKTSRTLTNINKPGDFANIISLDG